MGFVAIDILFYILYNKPMNLEQPQSPKQPTPDVLDGIFGVLKPTEEQIASRTSPDDIADMSGKNLLGHRDQALNNDEAATEEARRKIDELLGGK